MNRLRTGNVLPSMRRFSSTTVNGARSANSGTRARMIIGTTAVVGVGALMLIKAGEPLRADAGGYEAQSQLHSGKVGIITPQVFLWGRNSHNVASPSTPQLENIKKPKLLEPFDGMVLRDMVLHEKYGVAVDESGDVVQWGLGFDPASTPPTSADAPHKTLSGKDIMSIQVGDHKVFALSRKGEIFVFPAQLDAQRIGKGPVLEKQGGAGWLAYVGKGSVWGEGEARTVYEKLGTDVKLARGEKFISISTGTSHMLALTSQYRSFALPLNLNGNAYGQLAVKKVPLLVPTSSSSPDTPGTETIMVDLVPNPHINEARREIVPPKRGLDPLLQPMNVNARVPLPIAIVGDVPLSLSTSSLLHQEVIRTDEEKSHCFSKTLVEIPSLKGVRITQLVAGEIHSLALTAEGRVLGWGANGYGQLGLGASLSFPSIPTPTEIPLSRVYPKATRMSCTRIAAGGLSSYYVVETEDIREGSGSRVDLLASGNGQFGGIGNGSWAHAASPAKVKTISGLQEWSDVAQKVEPIPLKEITVGKNHIAIVLDNAVEQPGGIKFGRDVFVWGQNEFYQLGTGKRSNLSTPQHLPPLPYPGLTTPLESDHPASGTVSPMPHSRLQLAPEMKVRGKRVEETIVAGDGGSAVYWRIIDP